MAFAAQFGRPQMSEIEIRPLQPSDYADWRRLWTAYLDFYETTRAEEIYLKTWERLLGEGEFEPRGFLALLDGKPVGLVHYLFHRTCWAIGNNCYLQDLYAVPEARGWGVGRALIDAVAQMEKEAPFEVHPNINGKDVSPHS
jgi:GNAT superfamily N-acetyltransferase